MCSPYLLRNPIPHTLIDPGGYLEWLGDQNTLSASLDEHLVGQRDQHPEDPAALGNEPLADPTAIHDLPCRAWGKTSRMGRQGSGFTGMNPRGGCGGVTHEPCG